MADNVASEVIAILGERARKEKGWLINGRKEGIL